METITRKTLLYKSGLGFYCLNHVLGCSHGCRYPCYAFSLARHHGRVKQYAAWCRPKLVANALDLLDRELPRLRGRIDRVHLCLTTDPFMLGFPEVADLSLRIMRRLNAAGLDCSVLTKGIYPRELAEDRAYSRNNLYGISLVSLDEVFRQRWEPQAAPYADRIEALRRLHDHGCLTRAHLEPYPTPNILPQDLPALLEQVAFVDQLYFSGWNYNPLVRRYPTYQEFYEEQEGVVRAFCARNKISYEVD
jgi:DNA repair photolyase